MHALFRVTFSLLFLNIHFKILSDAHETDLSSPKSAIAFLTLQPSLSTINFAEQLSQALSSSLDVFIFVDDNQYSPVMNNLFHVEFIQLDEKVCVDDEFQSANQFGAKKNCSAWDKAIYYFVKHCTQYEFIWFVEDDVFIPSIEAFLAVHQLYAKNHDLVSPTINYILDGSLRDWYHTYLIVNEFTLPWAYGMVCAIGVSRNVLKLVDEFVKWRGHLTFIEFLFHTITYQSQKMNMVAPTELSTIVYRKNHSFSDIESRPACWWHPVKNFDAQREWRKQLASNSLNQMTNIIEELQNLEKLSESNSINERHLVDFSILIEQEKHYLPVTTRPELRERILALKLNQYDNAETLITSVADSIYKLPEKLFSRETWISDTSIIRMYETAIHDNKRAVLEISETRLRRNDVLMTIQFLRTIANELIRTLTKQMKCTISNYKCPPIPQKLFKQTEVISSSIVNLSGVILPMISGSFVLLLFSIKLCRLI